MKIVTPAMKLDMRIEKVRPDEGLLLIEGVTGVMPCKASLTPAEFRQLLKFALRPRVLALLFRK